MKKVSLLLISLLLVTAMNVFAGGETEGASELPVLELSKPYYFGSVASDNMDLKAEFEAWVAEYYGFKLVVNHYGREGYPQPLHLAMSAGDIQGIASVFGGSYMDDYYRDGATLALDQYVANNAVYKKLPADMQRSFVHSIEGEDVMVALPANWQSGLGYVRAINKTWLDAVGMELPETVYEFYDAIKAFTEDDPDGNGKDDTIGMTSTNVWMMSDIFNAFAAPLNHTMSHGIMPDAHDGYRYNDSMLKPGMKAALEWLRDAYANGYLDPEVWTNSGSGPVRSRLYSGQFGSTYYNKDFGLGKTVENQNVKIGLNYDWDGILGMTSDYADKWVNPGGIGTSGKIYVLLATTDNPQQSVDLFVNTFLGDEIGYMTGWFGGYGKYWEFGADGELFRKVWKYNEAGAAQYNPGPAITAGDLVGTNWTLESMNYRAESWTPEQYTNDRALRKLYVDKFEEGQAKELFFSYPHAWSEPTSDKYLEINADIKRIFLEMVAAATIGELSVDDALASYRRQLKALGAQQVLDEANAAIGKTSSTVYVY